MKYPWEEEEEKEQKEVGTAEPKNGGTAFDRMKQDAERYVSGQKADTSVSGLETLRGDYERMARMAQESAETAARDLAGGWGSSYAAASGRQAYAGIMAQMPSAADVEKSRLELEKMKKDYNAVYGGGVTEAAASAAEAMLADENFSPDYMDTYRETMRAKGMSEYDIEAAIGNVENVYRTQFADRTKQIGQNPLSASVQEFMADDAGYWKGTDKSLAATSMMSAALDRPEEAGAAMGYDDETWADMDDEDRMAAVKENLAGMVDAGVVSEDNFARLWMRPFERQITSVTKEDAGVFDNRGKAVVGAVLDELYAIEAMRNEGKISAVTADKTIEKLKETMNRNGIKLVYSESDGKVPQIYAVQNGNSLGGVMRDKIGVEETDDLMNAGLVTEDKRYDSRTGFERFVANLLRGGM